MVREILGGMVATTLLLGSPASFGVDGISILNAPCLDFNIFKSILTIPVKILGL